MKLSLNWLREFTDLGKIDPIKVGDSITIHTAELEETIDVKKFFQNVVTGKLLSRKSHPTAEKLSIAQFDCGNLGKKQIIFGQVHEVHDGEIYPVALDGAKLKSGIEIKNTEIRGEKSEGMIADNQELGMKNEGLIRFDAKTKFGQPLEKIYEGFADTLFDIDNKSLTHRPDLWGHEGFARELATIWDKKFQPRKTNPALPKKGNSHEIKIQSPVCKRFCALRMSGAKVTPSPLETQIRLENLDVRAISNLVDVTNLVLLELGQPMHVFDAAKVKGAIIVRQARQGEKLVALDGEEYELTPADTVVADEEKVLSIAGIMGGEFSGVSEDTTEIILECANWDPVAIRHTSTRLGLRSDSSIRYEKSLDPEACERALLRAVEYIQALSPNAKIDGPLTDEYPTKTKPIAIQLDPDFVRSHSGIDISNTEIKQKLESIDFKITEKKGIFEVLVPSYRATKDIAIAEDLVEEVVRLYGFENIPSTLPSLPVTSPRKNHLRKLEWRVRDFFVGQGNMEVFNYSFVDTSDSNFTGQKEYVTIENPLSSEHTQLRRTLISNMVRNIESELRTHNELNILEIGKIYLPQKGETLPTELHKLGLLKAAIGGNENDLFFALKGEIELFFTSLGLKTHFQSMEDVPPYIHPAKCAHVVVNEEVIGELAALHPSKNEIKGASIVFAELDLGKILKECLSRTDNYQKLSPFPAVHRDISLILDERTFMGDVEKFMYEASPLLKSVELFDEFQDEKKLGKGVKNLAFHLKFQSSEKTLDDKTIDSNFKSITDILSKKCGAKLRLSFDNQ